MVCEAQALHGVAENQQLDDAVSEAKALHSVISRDQQHVQLTVKNISAGDVLGCPAKTTAAYKSKRRKLKNKKVSFATTKRIHYVKKKSDSEINSRWYQKGEYERIKKEYMQTLMNVSRNGGDVRSLNPTEECVRGLEVQIWVLLLRMPADRQKKVVKYVLDLQKVQRACLSHNTDALRNMSLTVSKSDKLKAWKTAMVDAYRE